MVGERVGVVGRGIEYLEPQGIYRYSNPHSRSAGHFNLTYHVPSLRGSAKGHFKRKQMLVSTLIRQLIRVSAEFKWE